MGLLACSCECNGCGKTIFNDRNVLVISPDGERFAFCNSKCLSKWLQSFEPADVNKEIEEKIKTMQSKAKTKPKVR